MLQAFSLSYSPDPRVGNLFSNLNVSLAPGERVVLLGRNGSGKTKLLEILARELPPDAGRLQCDGRMGYLPQDVDLDFEGTLREYLSADAEDEVRLPRLLPKMGLVATQLEQRYASLSIGERMRASLARLLLMEPTVLLLDEPTNNLDYAGREWLTRFLLSSHAAVLMVCHDRAMIDAVADRVLELSQGRLTEFAGGYSE